MTMTIIQRYRRGTKLEPEIRELDNGDIVVDFGKRWFRCSVDGQVTAKIAKNGKVESRPATSKERLEALGHAAFSR